jgi:3-methyladenine DNA glycosylase AlkD
MQQNREIKTAEKVKNLLRQKARKEKVPVLKRFFKTGKGEYGEGDKFLGVMVPEQRIIAKKFIDLSLGELKILLESPWHEERLAALIILVYKFKKTKNELERKEFFNFYRKNIKQINNWDLVDLSCRDIVGGYLFKKDKTVLYQMAKSKNMWERRISVVATYFFISQGDCIETFKISDMLIYDNHNLIHKAVGWMLREAGKKCGEKRLRAYLDKNAKKMPRVMLRYAIEHMDEKTRKQYLLLVK